MPPVREESGDHEVADSIVSNDPPWPVEACPHDDCRAPIINARSRIGPMPIDPELDPDGIIRIVTRHGDVYAEVVPVAKRAGIKVPLYRPHFATCTHEWRPGK